MENYCTLFNSNYLSRGLNLYYSLKKVSKNFRLYIFAFDNLTLKYLTTKKLKNVTIISLYEFEDKELKKIKNKRTMTEYFWTCTGSTILYLFKKYKLKSCTYLDADLYFYKDPKILIKEGNKSSCMITKHNYSKQYDQSKTSGIYCVQFMFFKNDYSGLKILKDWRKQCLKWCYNRFENGKFGDQKYLDNWTKKYKKVHISKHLGGGLAPWNIQKYKFLGGNKMLKKDDETKFDMIFYHFHNLKFLRNGKIYIGGYKIEDQIKFKIYRPYFKKVYKLTKKLKKNKLFKDFDFNESYYSGGIFIFRLIKRIIKMSNFLKIN